MKMRAIKPGEALAIDASSIRQGPEAFFWLFGPAIKANSFVGDIGVVSVNGPLEHHDEGGGDCYDGIIARVRAAYEGSEDGDGDADDQHGPAQAVILRIDSPGGVVAGLNETVKELRSIRQEFGRPLIAFADEMAASAAYALCCACDEVILPASAIVGSIGVISTMVDQTAQDKKQGLRFVTLTSGARKADGHPHVAIDDDAISVEQGRVDKLARQFYKQVQKARGLPISTIQGFQAGIFLGSEAVRAGVADGVMGWKQFIAELQITLAQSDSTGSSSDAASQRTASPKDKDMGITLAALVRQTEKALKAEKDPKERASLAASLEAYKKTKHTIEKHESEEGGDEDEDAEEEGGNETDRSDKPEKDEDDSEDKDSDDDSDDDEESEEEEEESAEFPAKDKSAKALLALAQKTTGKRGNAAIGALAAMIANGQRAVQTVEKIQKERTAEKKTSLIDDARAKRRITRHEARELAGKPMSFVKSFLDMRPKAIIATDDDGLLIPSADPRTGDALPADLEKSINDAMAVMGQGKTADQKAALRANFVDAHKRKMNGATNGPRY
jgi:ClpP class serine protease